MKNGSLQHEPSARREWRIRSETHLVEMIIREERSGPDVELRMGEGGQGSLGDGKTRSVAQGTEGEEDQATVRRLGRRQLTCLRASVIASGSMA